MNQPSNSQEIVQALLLTAGRLFVHLLALLVVFVVLCGPVWTLNQYFIQENLKLPVVTLWVINESYRMNHYFHVIIPGLLLIDAVILAGLQMLKRPWRFLARLWFSGVLLVAVVLGGSSFVAMVVPLRVLLPADGNAVIEPDER